MLGLPGWLSPTTSLWFHPGMFLFPLTVGQMFFEISLCVCGGGGKTYCQVSFSIGFHFTLVDHLIDPVNYSHMLLLKYVEFKEQFVRVSSLLPRIIGFVNRY